MQNTSIQFSAHTLLSSLHGRNRHSTRNIGKRDLQAALKYGLKERGHPNPQTGEPRWKYTYRNIVYITEGHRSQKEVTSYVEPIKIPEAFVTPDDLKVHNRIMDKLRKQPSMVTSHTVFIGKSLKFSCILLFAHSERSPPHTHTRPEPSNTAIGRRKHRHTPSQTPSYAVLPGQSRHTPPTAYHSSGCGAGPPQTLSTVIRRHTLSIAIANAAPSNAAIRHRRTHTLLPYFCKF